MCLSCVYVCVCVCVGVLFVRVNLFQYVTIGDYLWSFSTTISQMESADVTVTTVTGNLTS